LAIEAGRHLPACYIALDSLNQQTMAIGEHLVGHCCVQHKTAFGKGHANLRCLDLVIDPRNSPERRAAQWPQTFA
jgi:hypothetical protein